MTSRLALTRQQILAFRRSVGALDERMPRGARSLRRAAWAGLQDSVPRAALLSIHARVARTQPDTWEDPALIQVWGPRFAAYVIAAQDRAVFTVGRTPEDPEARRFATAQADRLEKVLRGGRMTYSEVGRTLGINPNSLRYATTTGRVVIRWDGARPPEIWTVPAPEVTPEAARRELARRHLHVFGPSTPEAFAEWAGVRPSAGTAAFESLRRWLTPVRSAIGEAWILTADESAMRTAPGPVAPARLLPSGDTYFLVKGEDRMMLVPDATQRSSLWTPRVWPGAVLVSGEAVGTWRRAGGRVTIDVWRTLRRGERDAVETEAASLPLPDVSRIEVRWSE